MSFGFGFSSQRQPDKPTTPEEWHVIAWTAVVVLAACGAVGFYCGATAPQEHAAVGEQIKSVGLLCWVLAGVTYGLKRLVQWLMD